MALKDYPQSLLPREKVIISGIESLSDIELLSIILRTGSKQYDVMSLACNIMNEVQSLEKLMNLEYSQLVEFSGIGNVKAIEILAIKQICKRMNKLNTMNYVYANNPKVLFKLYNKRFENIYQEHFIVLSLNVKNGIIDEHTVFIGTLSQSLVHPRDIFKRIISHSASSFIILHNHPSGDPTPSENDLEITNHLHELSKLFAIPLLDHIIIGKDTYFSFKENSIF